MKTHRFKITQFINRAGSTSYRVSGSINGKQIRRNFKTRGKAIVERDLLEVKRLNASQDIASVQTRLTRDQVTAAESAFRQLADRSLLDAVNFYLDNYREPKTDHTIESALPLFLGEMGNHVGEPQLNSLRHTVGKFSGAVAGKRIHEITTEDVKGWLDSLGIQKKTFNNYRGAIVQFLSWCKEKPREWILDNPGDDVKRFRKIRMGTPKILTVAEITEFMRHAETYQGGRWALFFALAAFAGIRPGQRHGEMRKLHDLGPANFIDMRNGVIRIEPEIAKTTDLRRITIQPNLMEWLLRYPPKTTPLIPSRSNAQYALARKAFRMTHDILRHSFISYHVARFNSLGKTALEAGNSERIIRKHYLDMVTDKEADEFWRILPAGSTSNVVKLKGVAS